MKRILLVDDHHIVREGMIRLLRDLLDSSVEFDEAPDGQHALDKVARGGYDLVLLDIALPGRNGIDVLKQLRQLKPELPVLMVSMYSDEQYAVRALRAGAAGYLTKASVSQEFKSAIEKVLGGGKYVSPEQGSLLADALCTDADPAALHQLLSDREHQFACMLAQGKTMTEIAHELSLSVKTVSTYRSRVLEKLKLRTNADIINYCLTHGLSL